ncbi:MAG: PmoA family protein [Hyphomonas sp.]|nr:PmoA family protein [Hyphomonas sp.]
MAAPPVSSSDPDVSSGHTALEDWTQIEAPALRDQFQSLVYGKYPDPQEVTLVSRSGLDASGIAGAGAFEDIRLHLAELDRDFSVTYMLPEGAGPFPSVIQISFCGNKAAFGGREGVFVPDGLPEFCKGRDFSPTDDPDPYLRALPAEMLLARGYAVVSVHPGEVIPDNRDAAIPVLEALSGDAPESARTGALAAWGWIVSRAIDYLDTDSRFDPARTAVMGHSRNGKAAMAAAVFDERVDLAWLHQSGTGGATLFRTYEGESIENITGGFPHWLAPALREYRGREEDLPVDQDEAIALIAPRPVLVGGAHDDTWAGPAGAFAALQGASSVYRLFDGVSVNLPAMNKPDLSSQLAYFIRPGRHGVTQSDWNTFVDFMDVHFKGLPAPATAGHAGFDLALQPDRADLSLDGAPVISFRFQAPEGSIAAHAAYVHPLHAPSGMVITEDAPVDHPHHRGLFTAWRHIHSGDRDLGDAWEGRATAYQSHFVYADLREPDTAELHFNTKWVSLTGDAPEPYIEEQLLVRVSEVSPGVREVYQRSDLKPLVSDLVLEGEDPIKGYGGMTFRIGRASDMAVTDAGESIEATEAFIETSGGLAFSWPPGADGWPASIEIRCLANGEPVGTWIVRTWESAQNCTYPGVGRHEFEEGQSLLLESYMTIRQE